jgi:hypothetical protein
MQRFSFLQQAAPATAALALGLSFSLTGSVQAQVACDEKPVGFQPWVTTRQMMDRMAHRVEQAVPRSLPLAGLFKPNTRCDQVACDHWPADATEAYPSHYRHDAPLPGLPRPAEPGMEPFWGPEVGRHNGRQAAMPVASMQPMPVGSGVAPHPQPTHYQRAGQGPGRETWPVAASGAVAAQAGRPTRPLLNVGEDEDARLQPPRPAVDPLRSVSGRLATHPTASGSSRRPAVERDSVGVASEESDTTIGRVRARPASMPSLQSVPRVGRADQPSQPPAPRVRNEAAELPDRSVGFRGEAEQAAWNHRSGASVVQAASFAPVHVSVARSAR